MIDNKVKLVIWDLDETFWAGTLSEEGIVPIPRNLDIVTTLSGRGIVNSICSKNDYEQTKAKLVELGIWDYFVFPTISFSPKGKAISEMIEGAALRAENVLFIDDNRSNLEEVKYFNPGIMASHPQDVLEDLLDHPHLAGKPDPQLTRLKQYRFLQRKVEERNTSSLSNEEFLRESNIRISIDYDVDANFDRVVDLINRANQLNYTKQRVETPETLAEFRAFLDAFGFHAGCVRARDNYGDYGLIGFFLMQRRAGIKKLIQFVFSCRTMNMGIEQYIYEFLGKPDIEIVEPVSYGLQSHTQVDWIGTDDSDQNAIASVRDQKLVLLGGCDLLQLASYCSSNRIEFVNSSKDNVMVRYDDPGFILGDRNAIRDCETIRHIPCWSYEDAIRFDESIASSELILVSMWQAMTATYFTTEGGVMLRMKPSRLKRTRTKDRDWLSQNFKELPLDASERVELTTASFDTIGRKSSPTSQIFVLGCYTRGDLKEQMAVRRKMHNDACREYCRRHPGKFRYVDLDAVMPHESLIDKVHFSRAGYFALARHILDLAAAPFEPLLAAL